MESTKTQPPRLRRSILDIQNLLKEFDQGSVNAIEFCSRHNISKGTFYKWQSRYKRKAESKTKGPGFADISIVPSSVDVLFAEVKGIKIYQAVAASYLKELLQ